MKIYIDRDDWWVGLYRGREHWYVCLVPCVVIRIPKRSSRRRQGCHAASWAGVPRGCICWWLAVAGGWLRTPDPRCRAAHRSHP